MKYNYIETKNLIIRKATIDDLEYIYKNVWSKKELTKYMLWEVTNTKEGAEKRLNRTIDFQKNNFSYFVCLKENNEPIGFGGFKEIEDDVYEDIGICISNNYQGKGYGKEFLISLLDIVFNKLNGDKFIYTTFKDNIVSKKLCKSLDFKYFKEENKIRDYDNLKYICEFYYLTKKMYKEMIL